MEKIPYLGQTLLQWKVGNSTFVALPELGARLMNWNLKLGDGSIRDVLYWPETTTLTDFDKVRGGNPCLLYTSPSPRDGLLSRMPSSA